MMNEEATETEGVEPFNENTFSVRVPPEFIERILTENARAQGEIESDEVLEIMQMFYDQETGLIGFNGIRRKIFLN